MSFTPCSSSRIQLLCAGAALMLGCSPGTGGEAADAAIVADTPDLAVAAMPDLTAPPNACGPLAARIHPCATGSTTITGTIYDPAGKRALYGVVAYVPGATVTPFSTGVSCTSCGGLYSGQPIAAATSNSAGIFTIPNAPDGTNVPLVIQIGKWRRQFVLPSVMQCQENKIPDQMLRLPRNATEGDLPNIAVSTGGADSLECILSRIGIDAAEFVPGDSGPGHVHVFHGTGGHDTSPAAPLPAQALWNSSANINKYDALVLSCEGAETVGMNQQVLYDYANAGGRVLASHFHYAWFNTGPFGAANLATWKTGSNDIGTVNVSVVTRDWNNMTLDRGQGFHDWLSHVSSLTNDLLTVVNARQNASVTMSNTSSQPWLQLQNMPSSTQDFTFDTPLHVAPAQQCGRVAFTDMHVGATAGDYGGAVLTTPGGCAINSLSPQEHAIEYVFFDLFATCGMPSICQ